MKNVNVGRTFESWTVADTCIQRFRAWPAPAHRPASRRLGSATLARPGASAEDAPRHPRKRHRPCRAGTARPGGWPASPANAKQASGSSPTQSGTPAAPSSAAPMTDDPGRLNQTLSRGSGANPRRVTATVRHVQVRMICMPVSLAGRADWRPLGRCEDVATSGVRRVFNNSDVRRKDGLIRAAQGPLRPRRPRPPTAPAAAGSLSRHSCAVPGQHLHRWPAARQPHARPPVSLPRHRSHGRSPPRPPGRPAHRLCRHERRRPPVLPDSQRSLAHFRTCPSPSSAPPSVKRLTDSNQRPANAGRTRQCRARPGAPP